MPQLQQSGTWNEGPEGSVTDPVIDTDRITTGDTVEDRSGHRGSVVQYYDDLEDDREGNLLTAAHHGSK